MISDRHVVLRILSQAAVPLAFLLGLAGASQMGFGLGGPIAAALMISLGMGVYGLVFGFPALAKALPPWAMTLFLAGALLGVLVISLASPGQVSASFSRIGFSADAAPIARTAQAIGMAAAAAILCACVLMLQAIGARAQPLAVMDAPEDVP